MRWILFLPAWLGLGGCAAPEPRVQSGSSILLSVPFFSDKTDQCGPSTLASVLSYWGRAADPKRLRDEIYLSKLRGSLPMDLLLSAQSHGLTAEMVRGDLATLHAELRAGRPVIAMLNQAFVALPVDHYVVVTGFDEARKGLYAHSAGAKNQFIADKVFMRQWEKTDYWTLLARLP